MIIYKYFIRYIIVMIWKFKIYFDFLKLDVYVLNRIFLSENVIGVFL